MHKNIDDLLKAYQRGEREKNALLRASRAVLLHRDFVKTARIIFDEAREITGAKSGYVALLTEDGAENELLFLEAGGLPCDVDPHLPMPIRGLREVAYRTNQPVYENDFMNTEWVEYMPAGHVVLRNVLFAPLILGGRTVGVIGLANKEKGFTDHDAFMAAAFGEFASIALKNSQNLEKLQQTLQEHEKALKEIKTLRGMIPICSHCHKVRDEEGFWKKVDEYIQKNTDADITHGICSECMERYYSEFRGEEK